MLWMDNNSFFYHLYKKFAKVASVQKYRASKNERELAGKKTVTPLQIIQYHCVVFIIIKDWYHHSSLWVHINFYIWFWSPDSIIYHNRKDTHHTHNIKNSRGFFLTKVCIYMVIKITLSISILFISIKKNLLHLSVNNNYIIRHGKSKNNKY